MEASRTPPAGSTGPAPTLALPLKPYDVRQERDRGRRRHLRTARRRVLRITTLVALDLAALTIALRASVLLIVGPEAVWEAVLVPVLSVMALSLLVVNAYGAGSFRTDTGARGRAILLGCGILLLQAFFAPPHELSPWILGLFALLGFVTLEAERALVDVAVRRGRRAGYLVRPALIVGGGEEAQTVARQLSEHPDSDVRVVGRITLDDSDEHDRNLPVLGTPDRLHELVHERDARLVVLVPGLPEKAAGELVTRAFQAGASVLVMPSQAQGAAARLGGVREFDPTTGEIHPPRLRLPELGLKRALDLALTAPALLLLSPLMVAIAAAVKLDSPGPVLFRQTRLGVGGRSFTIWKFRTMVPDAEARQAEVAHLNQYGDGRLFKVREDPRVTRVGRLLRRTSLDELPQLVNVLRGEMSLVGPRPPIPEEVATYHEEHLVRLTVTPGLTGPWQANGRSDVLDFDEVVRLERSYIRDWSLWLDLRILARTLLAVLRGDGAA